MKAVVIHETGGPGVLRWEELPAPEPADGEVRVRVRAASVNPVDWKYRRERAENDLPMVLGRDFSGTVEASNADGYAEGDEVFGFAQRWHELGASSAHREKLAQMANAGAREETP